MELWWLYHHKPCVPTWRYRVWYFPSSVSVLHWSDIPLLCPCSSILEWDCCCSIVCWKHITSGIFFIGIHNHETALSLRRDLGLWSTVKDCRDFESWNKCISHTLEDRGRILAFVCERSDMGLCVWTLGLQLVALFVRLWDISMVTGNEPWRV